MYAMTTWRDLLCAIFDDWSECGGILLVHNYTPPSTSLLHNMQRNHLKPTCSFCSSAVHCQSWFLSSKALHRRSWVEPRGRSNQGGIPWVHPSQRRGRIAPWHDFRILDPGLVHSNALCWCIQPAQFLAMRCGVGCWEQGLTVSNLISNVRTDWQQLQSPPPQSQLRRKLLLSMLSQLRQRLLLSMLRLRLCRLRLRLLRFVNQSCFTHLSISLTSIE